MAIRSYLYTSDVDPTRSSSLPRGLCEHVGSIALAQLIMLTERPVIVESLLFEDQLAVIAERRDDRTIAFLTKLGEKRIVDPERFALALAQMQRVAAQTPGRYVLLEAGEVLADREDIEELVATLPAIAAQVERALRGEEDEWLEELREDWADLVMPWWANDLYFGFDEPTGTWTREQVEAMLVEHAQKMSAQLGHPFHYRLARGIDPTHLRAVVQQLPMLVGDVASVPDVRVWNCELAVSDSDRVAVAFHDTTLFVTLSAHGWQQPGMRRRIMHALGMPMPGSRFEYGRGVV